MKLPQLTKSNISVAIAFFIFGYSTAKAIPAPIPAPDPGDPTIQDPIVVSRVIDGDTIELSDGTKVRYIGIDTPESTNKFECYGKEAFEQNKKLVEKKTVRLEKDVSQTDMYGRLLRYVWVGDVMINEILVRDGYAQIATYPPDVKYLDRFLEAERQARLEKKGLWGDVCPLPPAKNTVGQ